MPIQAERYIRINTPLGEDVLLLERFEGVEQISGLFEFEATMLTESTTVDLSALLNQPVVVTVRLPDDSERNFHGFFNRIEEVESTIDGVLAYRGRVVPWLWYLSLFEDCRIFQNKSAVDIIVQVFQDRGFTDFRVSLTASYSSREYCVQYRETDLNFVSRLMEEEGICYFFQHTPEKHTLVLADASTAFAACVGQSKAVYDTIPGAWHDEDVVLSLRRIEQTRVGTYTLNDYDFTKPKTSLNANLSGQRKGEFYEYPGRYLTKDDGNRFARIRMEEQEVLLQTIQGQGNCRSFQSGFKFTLEGYYRSEANQDYTLIRVAHRFAENTYRSGDKTDTSFDYRNEFDAIPFATPFRPPRLARKPVMPGAQTAVVVGKSGEEIWVDQYGRVIVQFFWDRAGKMNEDSSCWIRVAQVWAGKGWGAIFTPRIGQEVIVEFLEGDPDRPLITGRVYNADQTVPYALPGEQTKSTIKSMSSIGGSGFNEFRLEDKKGSEQIFLHAEKDLHHRVKDSRFETILGATHLMVTKDQFEKVTGDTHLQVTGDQNEKISGTVSLNAGMDLQQKVGTNWAMDAGQEIHLKSGLNLVIESGVNLTLKVGGNFININPAGIFISGTFVNINSGGSAGSGAGASPQVPKDPTEADNADPGQLGEPAAAPSPSLGRYTLTTISPAAAVLRAAAQSGAAFCET